MKRTILAFAALAALNAGAVTTANAVELVVAPGRVYVGPDRHYGDEDYVGCRTIVESGDPGSGEVAGGISDGLAVGCASIAAKNPAAGRALINAIRRLSRTRSAGAPSSTN